LEIVKRSAPLQPIFVKKEKLEQSALVLRLFTTHRMSCFWRTWQVTWLLE